ncbi:MAG: MFS transporter [Alphaproteobacteria bacterium]|nr:MFS transporter [Alphaproteobacteria bacterium]
MSVLNRLFGGALAPREAKALALIILAGTGFSFSMGLAYPVIALVLEHQGFSETQIGVSGAMAGLGLVASAFVIPVISRRLGYRKTIIATGLGAAIVMVCMIPTDTLWVWAIERFLMGLLVAGIFIGTEAWMNELLTDAIRGRVVGVYASFISATFALGPAMMPIVGFLPPAPFLLGAAVILASAVVVLPLGKNDVRPPIDDKPPLAPILFSAPVIFLAIVCIGFFEAAAFSLFPIYVLERGHDETTAAYLVTAIAIGSVMMQPIIGWIADRATPRLILLLCAGASVGLCTIVPQVDLAHWTGYLIAGLLGGTSFGMYTLALTELGRRFRGGALAAAMAITAVAWGAGGVIGPAITGVAMDLWGSVWLPYTSALMFCALILAAALRGAARPTPDEA